MIKSWIKQLCNVFPALASHDSCRVIYFSWYLCNCMTSLSNVAFWPWSNTALSALSLLGFWWPLLFLESQSLSALHRKPLSHFFLSLPNSYFSLLQQVWLQHWTYVLSSFLLSITSVSADRSFFITFQAIWALHLYTGPSHLCESSFLWFCVSVCVFVCCLVVLATCCPSLWRPLWSWWTTALSPGTLSLWPSLRRSVRKMTHLTGLEFKRTLMLLSYWCSFQHSHNGLWCKFVSL